MDLHEWFTQLGEPLGAGLYEEEDRSLFYRKALGLRRYYESVPVPEYRNKPLYPSGVLPAPYRITPRYLTGFRMNKEALMQADAEKADTFLHSEFFRFRSYVPKEHTITGDMFTHSMPNYTRILADGLDGYEKRVRKMKDGELREGLLHVLSGIRNFHGRCLAYLRSAGADEKLITALENAPFRPAGNFYEAVLSWNWALYMDNCDNLGDVPGGLAAYYRGEDAVPLLQNLFENLDENEGYSMQAGMTASPLILACLRASKGMRRPMTELFVDGDTPEEVWEAALDDILSGTGSPAFYNRRLYRETFLGKFPSISEEDFGHFCGGGCTESMICGYSNVGSVDAGINLMLLLERCMKKDLPHSGSFEAFYEAYLKEVHETAIRVMEGIAASQRERAEGNPLPMRTLLVDDCIGKELDYNNGGARYMWSIVSFAGIINAIDSLLVIRDFVFRQKKYTAEELLSLLEADDARFLREAKNHPVRFGIDDPDANEFSGRFTHTVFSFLKERVPCFGLAFLPASIQFNDYALAGKNIGATPCGRKAGEALCDSLTAVFAKDTEGPTALIRSITSLALSEAMGTPVVNFTVNPETDRKILISLIKSYMELGGMQIQITCTSKKTLEEAYKNPDAYRNFVVRVGGYSEYFCRLDADLKKKILERTHY